MIGGLLNWLDGFWSLMGWIDKGWTAVLGGPLGVEDRKELEEGNALQRRYRLERDLPGKQGTWVQGAPVNCFLIASVPSPFHMKHIEQ